MPLFNYECPKCKHEYESLGSDKCPECNAKGIKILCAPNFVIKGSCSNPLSPKTEKVKENKEITRKKVLTDWYCPECEYVLEDEFTYTDEDIPCPKCKSLMKQVVGSLNFKLTYDPKKDMFDWQGNRSQYWSAVKDARRRGENVKGHNEN